MDESCFGARKPRGLETKKQAGSPPAGSPSFLSSEIFRESPRGRGCRAFSASRFQPAFRFFLPPAARPAKKVLTGKPACGYFNGMSEKIAFLEAFPEEWKAAAVILIVLWYKFRFLQQDNNYIKELLDGDRTSLNEKIGHIDKQLSNHITETNDKIKELKGEVKELKTELKGGQDKLEKKIDALILESRAKKQ